MTIEEAKKLKAGDKLKIIAGNYISKKQGYNIGDILEVDWPPIRKDKYGNEFPGVFYKANEKESWFIQFDWVEKLQTCICDIMVLMRLGCRCNGA